MEANRLRIAIVGAGIAGLTAAWYLRSRHDVTVFEAQSHLGGHTHTHDVRADDGDFRIDTGFIVFNDRTYPNFLRLLRDLQVDAQPTEMSFSVRNENSGLEYCGSDLNTLFAQRLNLLSPRFLGMLRDIVRFNRAATLLARGDHSELSLNDFLAKIGVGNAFVDDYLKPMGAAIWSSPLERIGEYPAQSFARFFLNHGLLQITDRPQWYVIRGGSRNYVDRIAHALKDRYHLNAPVRRIQRMGDHVAIEAGDRPPHAFDRVIMACHSDQALAAIESPSARERDVLGSIAFQSNVVLLHRDQGHLPKNRRAWASWNYRVRRDRAELPTVTYDMNRLQGLRSRHRFCVTLNQEDVANDLIERRLRYEHPVYTHATLSAQAHWQEIDGIDRLHYCGAYWGHGFHEDGVVSALRVVRKLGVDVP